MKRMRPASSRARPAAARATSNISAATVGRSDVTHPENISIAAIEDRIANATPDELAVIRRATDEATRRRAREFCERLRGVPSNAIWHALTRLGAGDWRTFSIDHIAYQWAKREHAFLAGLTIDEIARAAEEQS
ncbi:hypothetical protein [Burkholderia cenocepacia]|uniref:hypothetical protein n=1 Tax=Burkholderia cenocepacia TaxID=95486 RepID=UPI0030FA5572